MKRFLYYNQDSVNSFLAQIERGLLVKGGEETEHTEETSDTTGTQANISGDVSAKIVGIGASINGNVTGTEEATDVTKDLLKSVQEKVLHDYAFDLILNYAETNRLIRNDNPQIGDIVLVNDVLTFLDFKYFQGLFSDGGPVKFTNEQNKKTFEIESARLKEGLPKGGPAAVLAKQQIEEAKTKLNQAEPERKEMAKTIEIIRNTLPYDRFVLTNNMLVPLDNENFRDNPDIVAFKYGGKISVFGYVTNIVTADETPNKNNDFAQVYDSVNKIMIGMFKDQKKIYVVHPVALYY